MSVPGHGVKWPNVAYGVGGASKTGQHGELGSKLSEGAVHMDRWGTHKVSEPKPDNEAVPAQPRTRGQSGDNGRLVTYRRTEQMQKCIKANGNEVLTSKNEVHRRGIK